LSLTLHRYIDIEIHRLRESRRIFGPKRDGGMGSLIKLHNNELHNSYFSPNINHQVKEDKMGRACSTHGEKRNEYKILVGKLEPPKSSEKGIIRSLISRTKVICQAQKISTKKIKKIRHDLTLNEYTQKFVDSIIKLSKTTVLLHIQYIRPFSLPRMLKAFREIQTH
jgi:hypothetical protein